MKIRILFIICLTFSTGLQLSAQSDEASKKENSAQNNWGNAMLDPIEAMPRFPGCEDQKLNKRELEKCAKDRFVKYVYDKLIYPKKAKKNKVEGMVVVQFYITKEGKMTDLRLVRDIGHGCGEASMKIFEEIQKEVTWIPGTQGGKVVQVQYTMPVKFELPK